MMAHPVVPVDDFADEEEAAAMEDSEALLDPYGVSNPQFFVWTGKETQIIKERRI